MEFFETKGGHEFYFGTMPRIANSLERIAGALETAKAITVKQDSPRYETLCATLTGMADRLEEKGLSVSEQIQMLRDLGVADTVLKLIGYSEEDLQQGGDPDAE